MTIGNYGELKTAVLARSKRSDLAGSIPDFIRAAHDLIVNGLALSTPLTFDSDTVALPDDLRVAVSVMIDSYPSRELELADAQQLVGAGSGKPRWYSVDDDGLHPAPIPNASWAGRLLYKPVRTFFAADGDTNTALTRYPSLYLWGSMAELFNDLRNAVERDRYAALFSAAIDAANRAEQEDFQGAGSLQPKPGMVV